MKTLFLLIFGFLGILILVNTYKNSFLKNTFYYREKTDYLTTHRVLIKKLDELVTANYLNQNYYEVIVPLNQGSTVILNYNTRFNKLNVSTDVCSGYSQYDLTLNQLHKLANNNNFRLDSLEKLKHSDNFYSISTKVCNCGDLFCDDK
jgi:hypothetical protein